MKKIAIYCRVSTSEQTTENQKLDLIKYCEQRDYEIIKIYEDKGVSGSKSSRPALDQMIMDSKDKSFDVVLVWKLDRLGRSLKHLINLLGELNSNNVSFISFQESIDLTTPTGQLVFQILGAIGQFELSIIKSRVNAGLRRAKAENKTFGRPKKVFDYQRATDLHYQGLSIRKIACLLNVSSSTIHKYIRDCS